MSLMTDGFATLIGFADDSDVQMEEVEVTPPGMSMGGPIDVSTMRNTTYATRWPKSLKELTPMSLVVAYDPAFLTEILAMLGSNQLITLTYPGDEQESFQGFIDEFSPNAHVIGERPTAEMTIVPTLLNDSLVETAPTVPS